MKSSKNPQSKLIAKQFLFALIFYSNSFLAFSQPNEVQDVAVIATATFGQSNDIWQSFTPTQNGRLVQITFDYGGGTPAGTHTMNIYEDEGLDGTLLQSFDITVAAPTSTSQTKVVDLPLPVQVLAGNQYTFSISDINPRTLSGNSPETYTEGILNATYNGTVYTNSDLGFTTILDIGTNVSIESRDEISSTDPFYFDIKFYGTPTDLELADFVVSNGTADALNVVSGNDYELEVTTSGDGTVSVNIANGAALVDGLGNDAASASVEVDLPPFQNPDLILTKSRLVASGSTLYSGNPGINTMVFFAPEGTTDFTPSTTITQGTSVPDIAAPTTSGEYKLFLTDGAGNATAVSSTTLFVTTESEATTAAIEIDDENILPGETAEVLFLFLGAVTDLSNADLIIPNGTLTSVSSSDGNESFTATFTPNDDVVEANNTIVLDNTGITDGSTAGTGTTSSNVFAIDTGIPKVASIQCTSGCNEIYNIISGSERTIAIDVNFDRDVVVTGTVELELDFNATDKKAVLIQEAGTQNFTANYEMVLGDRADDLDYTGTDALTLRAGSSIVGATNSVAADLTLAAPGDVGSVSENRDIYVDLSPPSIVGVLRQSPLDETTGADEVTFRVTFSEPMDEESFGSADFSLTGTAAADGILGIGVMVDPSTYDYTITGIENSNGSIGLEYDGQLTDQISNNPIIFTTPSTSESYALINHVITFDSDPILAINQNEAYEYPIEVSSNFGAAALDINLTDLPDWLVLNNENIISTIAGGGGSVDEDIPATDAFLFSEIQDMEYDSEGNLYFIHSQQIKKVDLDGNISTFAGTTQGFSGDGGQASMAQFNSLIGFGIDGNDNFYVADRQNYRIRKIDNTGVVTTIAGTGVNGDSGDGGMANIAEIGAISLITVDDAGNVYFGQGNRIRKIGTDGIISTYAGNGSFGSPTDGQQATDANLSTSLSLATDQSGNLYIGQSRNIYQVDAITNVINNYAGNGNSEFSGDGGAATSAGINVPTGIVVDENGTLFIVDASNNRIRKVTTDGVIKTIAGTGSDTYSGEGVDALTAGLNLLNNIAVDQTGQVVFSDRDGTTRVIRSIQTNRAILSGTPDDDNVGANEISLTATSGVTSTAQNFTISVTNINDEPELGTLSFTATQDEAFEATVTASDVDGDFTSLSLSGSPDWLSSTNSLQTFTFTSESGNFSDIIWDGENYLMANGPLHTIQSVDALGQNLTAVAGSGSAVLGSDDGIGLASRFNNPFSLDIDSNGKVYVVDNQNHSLREMVKDDNGDYVVSTNPISLSTPIEVLVAPNDDVYISDTGSGTIKKISGGVESTLQDAGATDITFVTPYGLAIDNNDILYVVDNGNHAIYKIDGTTKTLIAGTEGVAGFTDGDGATAQFDAPTGLWVNEDGTVLIVSENENDAIRRIDIDGATVTVSTLDDGQSTPLGMLLDPNSGSFLIANFDFASIIQGLVALDISGTPTKNDVGKNQFDITASDENSVVNDIISIFVANVNDAPEFTSDPTSVEDAVEESLFSYTLEASDIDGDVLSYTGTSLPSWLNIEQPEHIVSTIAGNGIDEYSGDAGVATDAGIGTPEAIAVDFEGNVYIGQDNYIRKVSTDGTISTIAGDGSSNFSGDGIPAINSQIKGVSDLHAGPDGSLYISTSGQSPDGGFSVIRKINRDGIITTVAGVYNENFESSGDGALAVDASFAGMHGIFVNNSNEIFIADQNDGIIRKIGTDGIINTVATSVSGAFDVVEDNDGFLYVVNDSELTRVDEIDTKTDLLNGQFQFTAQRIDIDNLGNIYGVTNFSPNTILNVYSISTGQVEVFANEAQTSGFSGDEGVASLATFDKLESVATGLDGSIYLVDSDNNRIRKLTPQNAILTGTPSQGDAGDHSIVIQVSDGLLSDEQSFTQTVLGLPHIIEVTSGIDDAFGIGEEVSFQLGFDENVTLSGSGDLPSITLETGDTDRVATWSGGGDGAANIVFTYIVQEGDQSGDLEYTSTELNLGGYTLKSDDGIDSRIDLPTIGGGSSLAGTSAIVVDGIRPTISNEVFVSNNSISNERAKVGDEITFSFSTSETLQADPIVSIAGNAAVVTSTGTNAYTSTYTMTEEDEEGSIDITADFIDASGNEGNQFTGFEAIVEFDKTVPELSIVSISSSNVNPEVAKEGDEITLSITSSESLVANREFNLEATINGSDANVSEIAPTQYSLVYTVTSDDTDGLTSFEIDFFDITGNEGIQVIETTDESSVTIDLTNPTVELASASSDPTNSAFDVNITFSEKVSGFSIEDLTLVNATSSDFSGEGSSYVVQINPSAGGSVSVDVAADVASDEAGNGNTASNSISVVYDATSPTVELTTASSDPTNTAFDVNITFSEEVSGFSIEDLTLVNATASDFSGEGSSYVVQINPTADGSVSIDVDADIASDEAGNGNTASNSISVAYDATSPTVELTTASSDPTNTAFDVNITFSEEVSGFSMDDLTLVNATTSDFSGEGSIYVVKINPTTDGSVSIDVDADIASDEAGNGNAASNSINAVYDATSPTVELTTASSDPTNTAFDVTITFSEEVSGFSMDDLTLVNATASDFSGEGSIYVVQINPTTNGSVAVEIAADVASDKAGNGNTVSNSLSIDFSKSSLTVEIATTSSDPTNTAFDITITFNESVTDFELNDLTVINGQASNFEGSGLAYSATITPDVDGIVSINIDDGVASNSNGDNNSASNAISIEFDNTNPTVEVTTSSSNPTNSAFDISIIFNEEVTGFELADLTIINGQASNFEGVGDTYTATITALSDGDVTVDIEAGVASDHATNENVASNTLTINYDGTNPAVEISTEISNSTNEAFDITILFSESVSNFEMSDVTIVNGTISDFSGDATTYTATINPTINGTVSIEINSDVVFDEAGNGNTASNTLSIEFDNTRPSVDITTTSNDLINSDFDVNIIFSEDVSGFELSDLSVSNGTASNFAGSGAVYSATISPSVDGIVEFNIEENVATNNDDKGNIASNTISIEFDGTNPSITISSTSSNTTNTSFEAAISFSEDVIEFDMSDISVTNGTASNFAGSGNSYTATITATTDGTVSVDIAASAASDAAGNGNEVSNTLNVEADFTNPTVSITTSSSDPTNTSFDINMTFSEEVSGFDMGDISVTNGTASNFAGSGNSYTATITATTDGTVLVDIAASAASDAAGNGNEVSNTLSVEADLTNPTVSITASSSDPTNTSFDINMTFSEEVSGFDMGDISVTNGTASNFAGSGDSYTATITATTNGTVSVDIAADAASDAAGNGNEVSNTLSIVLSSPLSIPAEMELNVYPNPVSNRLTIKAEERYYWRLLNLEGKVFERNDTPGYNSVIDVSKHASGLYLLEVVFRSTIIHKKIKINH